MTSMPPLSTPDPTPVAVQPLDFIPDSDQALSNELTRLAGHINAAQYRFLKLLAALIQRDAWNGDGGMKSPAHWLNYYCGIDLGAAREKVRVAKALQALPKIDQAFASGAISYSKVRAVTRSATAENEGLLLDVAKSGTAQHVEMLVRQHRRVKRLELRDKENNKGERESNAQHKARALSCFYDEDGMLVIKGRFAPEDGAVIVKAIETALDSIAQEESQPEAQRKEKPAGRNTFPQKRADALLRMAEQFLISGRNRSRQASQQLSNADKYQVLVHFDARASSGSQAIGMAAHLDNGPPLPETTCKRLACDASLVAVLRDDTGNVLNIGRKSRIVPPAIRRALKIRDGGCRYPGCCQSKYVDAHHIQHWCDGGETSLDNLVLLCRHHHRLLHDGVFAIETDIDEGKNKDKNSRKVLRFMTKHGNEIQPALYPQFKLPPARIDGKTEIELDNERRGLVIATETAVTRWQGERMDYGMATDGILRLDKGRGYAGDTVQVHCGN